MILVPLVHEMLGRHSFNISNGQSSDRNQATCMISKIRQSHAWFDLLMNEKKNYRALRHIWAGRFLRGW